MKRPKFERDTEELIVELKELSNFENADIRWNVRSFKDTSTYYLVVNLINGKDLPEEDAELKEIGQEAMKIVVNSIENENVFDKFRVVFEEVKQSGAVTRRNKIPFEYSLSDIAGED
ncbi:hypothetical protein [Halocola ammonii]